MSKDSTVPAFPSDPLKPDRSPEQRLTTGLLVCAAACLGLVTLWKWASFIPGGWIAIDYKTFFAASRLPVETLYGGPPFLFVYPPTGILFLQPLSLLDFWAGYAVLGLVSATVFVAAVRRTSDVRVALLAMLSFAALENLIWGQIAMVLAAALIWALTLPEFRRGLVIGVLASLKPQLFLAAPFVFLVRREWTTIGGMAVGGLTNILVSIAVFGVQPWLDWLALLPAFPAFFGPQNIPAVITPTAFALNLGVPVLPVALAGVGLAIWAVLRARYLCHPLALAAVIGGASILASPYALPHDAMLVLPAAAMALLGTPGWVTLPAALLFTSPWTAIALPAFLLLAGRTASAPELKARRAARTE